LVMGGLMAPALVWANFSTAWAACLQAVPKIDYFKLFEATGCTGQFSTMGETARDAKVAALAAVLLGHEVVALRVSVHLADHAEFSPATRRLTGSRRRRSKRQKRIDYVEATAANPYFQAYVSFILGACYDLWEFGLREQFDFIADEHPSLGARTAAWYPVVKSLAFTPMRSIMPAAPVQRDDETFLPLQAADMIAGLERLALEGKQDFAWLRERLTAIRSASRCVCIDRAWFLRTAAITKSLDLQPTLESMIELARLQGAPIPGPDDQGKPNA
ncbi:MAG: hypothetical protein M3Z54_10380, partial [Gemmatimonadota bacterium]|nr:hypothetical protein [Gemmatimonadota bacterium]